MNVYGNKFMSWLIWRVVLRNPKLRLRVTRLLVRSDDRDVELFGSRIRINTVKEIGYARAARSYLSNIVTRDEAASLLNLALIMEPRDVFVDVGANVGLYSGIIGRLQNVIPGVRYYAFEANPDTFVRLQHTLDHLGTRAHCVAVSDREGTLQFCGGAVSGVFGAVDSASEFQDLTSATAVNAVRLDRAEIIGGSLVLKIDVEGHEWEVLNGARGLFEDDRVKAVYLDGFKDPRCSAFLTERGFRAFDGRSLSCPPSQSFSLLWISEQWIRRVADVENS